MQPAIAVVIATRQRVGSLLSTLDHLAELPERPQLIVVDNGSSDDTARAVKQRRPDALVVPLPGNHGAYARNIGVRVARAYDHEYVAFADDDSWFAPGALASAVQLFEDRPRLGLVAARIMVGDPPVLDPTCALMASGRSGTGDPRPASITGFLACGAIVRARAFLSVGGFEPTLLIGAEEQLLTWDLLAAGWDAVYAADVVAHHHPSPGRRPALRRWQMARHDAWSTWARLPWPLAAARTTRRVGAAALAAARRDPAGLAGIGSALLNPGWALARRRPLAPELAVAVAA